MNETMVAAERPGHSAPDIDFEVIVIGAGVAGIYQIKRLIDLGVDAVVFEGGEDLGGTWFWNRYPGARFDSESYTYGYSFSQEVLDEWHWKERFSSQPENLRYLNYVADKFDLRRHMRFNHRVEALHFQDETNSWFVRTTNGDEYRCRYVVMGVGPLSAPTPPRIPGRDDFTGVAHHTFHWPREPVDFSGKRVGVIGTGATGIQVIAELQDKCGELYVFQRRPNWSAPLNNSPISLAEMDDIRSRYDEIFDRCARSPGGFEHEPDRRGFWNVSRQERLELWDRLYDEPGFGIWLGNFVEIFTDEAANAELSEYIADRIRRRVRDPEVAEKLIPRDHGFGMQRVPLETHYFEAYNRPNVHLVDLSEAPIARITENGIQTAAAHYELDVLVYATGFDAITGTYDRMDIRGTHGSALRAKWDDGPVTYLGALVNGFPNLVMLAGPQSGSASTNFPRGIESSVDWASDLLEHMWSRGHERFECTPEAEAEWTTHVESMYENMLMRKAKGWFTGYNSNVDGHEHGKIRYFVYNGGAPKYVKHITEIAANGYDGICFS